MFKFSETELICIVTVYKMSIPVLLRETRIYDRVYAKRFINNEIP